MSRAAKRPAAGLGANSALNGRSPGSQVYYKKILVEVCKKFGEQMETSGGGGGGGGARGGGGDGADLCVTRCAAAIYMRTILQWAGFSKNIV